jgi:acyl-CoA dehydrogenase
MSTGSWELPEEYRMLRDTVRRFMERDVKPIEDTLPHDANAPGDADLERLQRTAREMGLWCVQSPKQYGGAELSLLGQCIVAEETAKCRMGAYIPALGAFGFDPPLPIFSGAPWQIEKYAIPTIERGEKTYVAISEPSGGSDPARSIQTTAVRKGDRWVLNGTKVWITSAHLARWGLVFARTERSAGRSGISCFIVETDSPGLSMKTIPVIRSYYPNEMAFQDCEIPAENMLGDEGQGFQFAEKWLVHGRVPYAAGTIGVAQAALDLAIEWARQRTLFKSTLADKQAIQWMIADSDIDLRAARLLTWQAAWNADLGKDIKIDASVAKVFATEAAGRVVDRAIQIFGGLGVAKEMPLERWYRELRIKRIGEGPSEVHRMVLARDLINARRGN